MYRNIFQDLLNGQINKTYIIFFDYILILRLLIY